MHAAGVNPTDWKHRAAAACSWATAAFVLGWDVSGVVEAVGLGVTLFKPGDEVFGMLPYPLGPARTPSTSPRPPVRSPASRPAIDHVQAARLPLAALTAWQALVDTAGLRPGQRVLIHAAAGGVGHVAVQIAKARGAYVIGTASAGKHELLRELGADELIDYRETDFTEVVRGRRRRPRHHRRRLRPRSLRTLREGGIVVSLPRRPRQLACRGGTSSGVQPRDARGARPRGDEGDRGAGRDGQAAREIDTCCRWPRRPRPTRSASGPYHRQDRPHRRRSGPVRVGKDHSTCGDAPAESTGDLPMRPACDGRTRSAGRDGF